MGRDLLEREPVFRQALLACDAAIGRYTGWSVAAKLAEGATVLERADVAQPVLFAFQVALCRLWESLGVRAAAVIGHSMGEVAAAHVAGALSLEDAARLISARSRNLEAVRGRGTMAVVECRPRRWTRWSSAGRGASAGPRATAPAASPSPGSARRWRPSPPNCRRAAPSLACSAPSSPCRTARRWSPSRGRSRGIWRASTRASAPFPSTPRRAAPSRRARSWTCGTGCATSSSRCASTSRCARCCATASICCSRWGPTAAGTRQRADPCRGGLQGRRAALAAAGRGAALLLRDARAALRARRGAGLAQGGAARRAHHLPAVVPVAAHPLLARGPGGSRLRHAERSPASHPQAGDFRADAPGAGGAGLVRGARAGGRSSRCCAAMRPRSSS